MKLTIVAIRDIKTDSFFTPQYVRHAGAFLRQLQDEINTAQQPNTVAASMAAHPEDYEVIELGTWEDQTGRYEIHDEWKQVTAVSNLKR